MPTTPPPPPPSPDSPTDASTVAAATRSTVAAPQGADSGRAGPRSQAAVDRTDPARSGGTAAVAPPRLHAASDHRPAGASLWAWLLLLSVFTFGFSIDLASKYLAFEHVGPEPVRLDRALVLERGPDLVPAYTRHVVPKLLDLKLILNPGAVFGIGPGKRWFFIVFTVIAMGTGLIVFAWRTRAGQHLLHLAIGLVLAGAAGNLYDRLFYGAVRDFLYIFPGVHLPFGLHWPQGHDELFPWVFNVADVLLLTGIGILVVLTLLHPPDAVAADAADDREDPREGS